MADIAARADVGVASLYRRYPTRQALVHALCLYAMGAIAGAAMDCVRRLGEPTAEPWAEFVGFIAEAVAAGAGSMRTLAGTFHADAELAAAAAAMNSGIQQVVSEVQRRGAVRSDVSAADLTQFFEMLRAIRVGDHRRSDELRQRYLRLFSTALRASPAAEAENLVVPAPEWDEISTTWNSGIRPTSR